MLDVGQQQFLMLLFVLQAQLDARCEVGVDATRQLFADGGVDALAVVAYLLERWPRKQAALRTRMHGSDGFVIGVEQVIPLRVWASIGRIVTQHELLEKPGGMRKMPFAGAGIGHRLHLQVFAAQAFAQRKRLPADTHEPRKSILGTYGECGDIHGAVSVGAGVLRPTLWSAKQRTIILPPCRSSCSHSVMRTWPPNTAP